MCGLVGVAGLGTTLSVENKYKAVFRDMLMLDTIRGAHSTGIAMIDSLADVHLLKTIGTPWDLMELKAYDIMFHRKPKLLMGHNRWATKGKVNKRNAHPFENDTIIGTHNGTLRNQSLLPDHTDFDVDSENIFHSFDKQGIDATVKNLNGAYALVWWDKAVKLLHFLRNNERPLFYCYTKDRELMLYASEVFMLRTAAYRNELELDKIWEVKKDHLYSFQVPFAGQKFKTPRIEKLEVYVAPVFMPKVYQRAGKKNGKNIVDGALDRISYLPRVVNEDYDKIQIDAWGTDRIDYAEFLKRTRGVCAVCDGDLNFVSTRLIWTDRNTCVCGTCADHIDEGADAYREFTEVNRWKGWTPQ